MEAPKKNAIAAVLAHRCRVEENTADDACEACGSLRVANWGLTASASTELFLGLEAVELILLPWPPRKRGEWPGPHDSILSAYTVRRQELGVTGTFMARPTYVDEDLIWRDVLLSLSASLG